MEEAQPTEVVRLGGTVKLTQLLTEESAVVNEIRAWVNSTRDDVRFTKNKWFYGDDLSVYVRYQRERTLSTHLGIMNLDVLTVANITVNPERQGQGVYSTFLSNLELLPIDAIIIENVQDPAQVSLYERRGYRFHGKPDPVPSMIKLLERE